MYPGAFARFGRICDLIVPVPPLNVIHADYPTRLANLGGLVLIDFLNLAPEVDGDPQEHVLRTIDAAAEFGTVAVLARVRNSRPPPHESRKRLLGRLGELQDQLRCVSLAVEGAGFRVVAFRSFVAAARLLNLTAVPVELFGHLPDARAEVAKRYAVTPEIDARITEFFGTDASDG